MPDSPAPLTPAVFHILLALAEGPLHGYGIMRRVEDVSGRATGPGTIYGSIQRLCDAGWLAEGAAADEGDARRGRTFELTSEGRAALAEEARRITRLARLDDVRRLAADAGA